MKNILFAFTLLLLASPPALSQGQNCGWATMVLTGSNYSCPSKGGLGSVYAATGSYTYQDTCYALEAPYSQQTSTVSGAGECAIVPGVGNGSVSNCPPVNSTSIVYSTTQSGLNAMYNYAYNTTISWPPGGGSVTCPKTTGFTQDVKYCATTWCLTNGGGCTGSAPCQGGGGGEECYGDDSCGGACCYNGYCIDCELEGLYDPDRQIRTEIRMMAKLKRLQQSIGKGFGQSSN